MFLKQSNHLENCYFYWDFSSSIGLMLNYRLEQKFLFFLLIFTVLRNLCSSLQRWEKGDRFIWIYFPVYFKYFRIFVLQYSNIDDYNSLFKKIEQGRQFGSTHKSTGFSARDPRFDTQHPHGAHNTLVLYSQGIQQQCLSSALWVPVIYKQQRYA